MSRRGLKVIVVAAAAVALTGVIGATAWAETVTPGVEQPVFDLGAPNSLLGGQSVPGAPTSGNQSSAEGRNGSYYGSPYGRGAESGGSRAGSTYGRHADNEAYDSGSPFDDAGDNGYWRESGEGSTTDDSSDDE